MSKPSEHTAKPMRLLVIDDEPTTLVHFARTLRKAGFDVTTAEDAASGLELHGRLSPDLTLLDLHMPGMDGLEVLTRIRKRATAVEAPVIVCTANGAEESLESALATGANDYLIKPVSSRSMLARVTLHLNLTRISRELALRDQKDAIAAMVVTYNHELNTPLAVILAFLELLMKRKDLPKEAMTMIERSRGAADRAAQIVRRIREVSRKSLVTTPYSEQTNMVDLGKDSDEGEPAA